MTFFSKLFSFFSWLSVLAFAFIISLAYSPEASASEAVDLYSVDLYSGETVYVKECADCKEVEKVRVDYIPTEKYTAETNEVKSLRTANTQTFYDDQTQKYQMKIWNSEVFAGDTYDYKIESQYVEPIEYNNLITEKLSRIDWLDYFFINSVNAVNATGTLDFDTWINESSVNTNYESSDYYYCGTSVNGENPCMIKFTVPEINGEIDTSIINIYTYEGYGNGTKNLNLHKILRTDTNGDQVTWNIYKTGSNWTTAGAQGNTTDYDNTVLDSIPLNASVNAWKSFDNIGTIESGTSYIWILMASDLSSTNHQFVFRSSEYVTASFRPYLYLEYTATEPDPDPDPVASSSLALSDRANNNILYYMIKIFIILIIFFAVLTAMYKFWDFFIDMLVGRKNI